MGQRRLQVAELLMTLDKVTVNEQMMVSISHDGRLPKMRDNWSPIHLDKPDIYLHQLQRRL